MAAIGSVIEGKYEVLKQIGKGGMSVVYLAMDKRLNKQWAVKEIRKTCNGKNNEVIVNSLLAEANLMKRLDHPALPRIVDIIDNGETIYVIMDYIEGESLDKILNEYGAQPEELVVSWAKQLCDALNYLHSQHPPVIYRDVKPANIMLKPEGNVKVIDFGIAREYKEQSLSDTTVLGTRGYAPPEQHGSRQTDARSDIFALGMTMHHLLTGADPRPADYMYLPVRHWNSSLSDGIEAIINKCTALDPADRYQNCSELLYDLEHPDLITSGYKMVQKKRVAIFVSAISLSVLMLISGLVCGLTAIRINNNTYDSLISISTSSDIGDKVSSYNKAISLYPKRTEAYMRLVTAYEDSGEFSQSDSNNLLAQYNKHQSTFDKTSEDYAELNYAIGRLYFSYYSDDKNPDSFLNRVTKAYAFFASNHELEQPYAHRNISECYYQICLFYKKYILTSAKMEEATYENYVQLLSTLNNTMVDIKNENQYDQLMFYNGVFMLLYDQRNSMYSVRVELTNIVSLLDTVYDTSKSLSVNKEQSKQLQNEIIDNYTAYKEAIMGAYDVKGEE